MSWTDERIEVLSKLWSDGKTASQIATELGLGVTRNAVIGKIHRLGLASRAKTNAQPPIAARARLKPASRVAAEAEDTLDAFEADIDGPLEIALKPVVAPLAPALSEVVIPLSERVTIMDLRESSCRWPMGDPTNAEFRFCGARTGGANGPYCLAHSRLAFQPAPERRRDRVERFARIN